MWERYKQSFIGQLPLIVQLILWIVLLLIIFRAFKWLMQQFKTGGQRQETKAIKDQISDLQSQGLKASYSSVQYSTWANQLQEAFNGCGTSDQVWRNIFSKMKNDMDLALLMDSYGVRTIDECNWELNFGDFKGSLSETIVHELDDDEVNELNQLLSSNNLTMRI